MTAPYVKVNFRDVTTGACWSWRMREDVAHLRAPRADREGVA